VTKAKILIVEDEAIVAEDLSQKLRRLGYEVVGVTASGEASLASAREHRPDLVLMDIRLQGPMDGVEAARLLRREYDIPVFYLTAHSDSTTLQRAKLTEPFGYILKPYETRQLETQIEMALYKHQADREVQRHREWLNVTLQSIGDAVITTDAEGRVTSLNPAAEQLTGWKGSEAHQRPLAEVFHIINERTREPALSPADRVLREGKAMELANHTALISRTGRETAIEDSAAPILDARGRTLGVVMVFHDVTEKRLAQEALHQSKERLALALRSAGMGVWRLDLRESKRHFDEQVCRCLGIDPSRFTGTTEEFYAAVHPDDRDPLRTALDRMMETGAPYEVEYRAVWPDGSLHHIAARGQLVSNAAGQPERIDGLLWDISQRKRAEEELRESRQRLDLALHSAKMGIWDWDIRNDRMTWDDQMFLLYGIAHKPTTYGVELWKHHLHPEDRARAWEACQAALRGDKEYDVEFRVSHPDGTTRHIKANGQVLWDEQRKPIRMLGVNYDVTERRLLEQQLLQAQKMEAIGQLAGGVAHDFNNILAASLMHLGLLRQDPSLTQVTVESLKELEQDSRRAANLTRQLLLFSRRSTPELKPLDLNEVVTNLLKMLKRVIGEHIAFQVGHRFDLPWVMADPGMVEQVLMNLCVNARDAMPKGGRVEIGFEVVHVDEPQIRSHPDAQPGQFVCLSVADTGCGMDESTRQRVFEPFFTTKGPGKGTGLGLATVHGILGLHKGWVEFQSEPGQGSVFRAFFPATAIRASEPLPADEPKLLPGHEIILLVEDEASLRRVTSRGLRALGYNVLEAADGREALKLWTEHHAQIDLLLSDMVMPGGLTGLELAEQLRASMPGLKVIISSGYSAENLTQKIQADPSITRLQKPCAFQALSKTIRQCLDDK
jgi:two-component system, cell cycle sensor histidine kinase and response regulator CckA